MTANQPTTNGSAIEEFSKMSGRIFGKVARWHPTRGFGFIQGDDGEIYFCHFTSITNAGVDELPPEQKVSFQIGMDNRTGRTKAVLVDLIGDLPAAQDEHRTLADAAFMRAGGD